MNPRNIHYAYTALSIHKLKRYFNNFYSLSIFSPQLTHRSFPWQFLIFTQNHFHRRFKQICFKMIRVVGNIWEDNSRILLDLIGPNLSGGDVWKGLISLQQVHQLGTIRIILRPTEICDGQWKHPQTNQTQANTSAVRSWDAEAEKHQPEG